MSIPIIIPMDQAFQPMESSIFSLAEQPSAACAGEGFSFISRSVGGSHHFTIEFHNHNNVFLNVYKTAK
jgi:hypothetical protein